jgi:membrane-associated phospholipid phosphatase
MSNLLHLLYIKRFYFLPAFLFAALLLSLLLLYPEGRSFFIINGIHSPVADTLFTYITYLGDGWFVIIIGLLILLFYKYAAGLACLLGFAFTGGLNSLLKNHVFLTSPRPKHFFWRNPMVHYVQDVQVNVEHSFPSGHANAAFFVFTFIVLLRWKHELRMQLLCVFCACAAAYSRVYLAQHFIGDIFFGMLIGASGAFLFYAVYRRLKQVPVLNGNIVSRKKRK